jgi:hypothetical protein
MSNYVTGTGLERVQVAAWRLLAVNLNDEIDFMQPAWDAIDQETADIAGTTYVPVTMEHVALQDYFRGHRPSVLTAPINRFPAVAVLTSMSRFTPIVDSDQGQAQVITMAIELVVRSAEITGQTYEATVTAEDQVNSRCLRTVDAIRNVIARSPSLGGSVAPIAEEPIVRILNVAQRRERTTSGLPWLIQGARLEYMVERPARLEPLPSPNELSSRVAAMAEREDFAIDQQ